MTTTSPAAIAARTSACPPGTAPALADRSAPPLLVWLAIPAVALVQCLSFLVLYGDQLFRLFHDDSQLLEILLMIATWVCMGVAATRPRLAITLMASLAALVMLFTMGWPGQLAVLSSPLAVGLVIAQSRWPHWAPSVPFAQQPTRPSLAELARPWLPFAIGIAVLGAFNVIMAGKAPFFVNYADFTEHKLELGVLVLPMLGVALTPMVSLVLPRVGAMVATVSLLLSTANHVMPTSAGGDFVALWPMLAIPALSLAGWSTWSRHRRAAWVMFGLVAILVFTHLIGWTRPFLGSPNEGLGQQPVDKLFMLGVTTAFMLGAGLLHVIFTSRHRARVAAQEQARLDIRVAERTALARDLHDVIAHHISLIAVRAETAPYTHPELGDSGREVLAAIAEDARRTLDELRTVLGVLKRQDLEAAQPTPLALEPQRQVGDIEALVQRNQESGLQVSFTDLRGPYAELVHTAARGNVAYRVVQEGLTNARRHAPGQPVMVLLADTAPHLVISNPMIGPGSDEGTGSGLIGMRERVEAIGGQVEITTTDGEFRMEVSW